MRGVTIVVPIYKDWETLRVCIDSLKECVAAPNRVLLVNDHGPEWQEMEHSILAAIEGCGIFRYELNPENLGFVKTCNRAVTLAEPDTDILLLNSDTKVTPGFLEEMQAVLYASERHGAVCPRSNHATLLTVPCKKSTTAEVEPELSRSIYEQVFPLMPRWSILPTGVGFALLIKRELIERFGLFDEVYSPGYNEENDFCMRINGYGYNIVSANHAYVYHYESKSFGGRRSELDAAHFEILSSRYPYYSGIVNRYFNEGMDPVDYFADLIADGLYPKKRILFSLYEMPAAYNGTAKYSLSIYQAFCQLYRDKYDIYLLVNSEADRFHKISERFQNVFHPDNITGTFHVAFSPSQIYNIEHMFILNRTCLKYMFCMQDIISIRSDYLLVKDIEREQVFRDSIRFCDKMTSISEFSLADTIAFYKQEFTLRSIPTQVIYHGTDKVYDPVAAQEFKLPFEQYFVVFGNFYKHKFITPLLEALSGSQHKVIVIGSAQEGLVADNIYGYLSGNLSDEFIDSVVGRSLGIVFPSVYEGFGLPFLDGMSYRKKLVVNNTELNRELKDYFANYSKENVYIFDSLKELDAILDEIEKDSAPVFQDPAQPIRNWFDSARELEQGMAETLAEPTDTKLLYERWRYYSYLSNIHRCYVQTAPVYVQRTRSMKQERFLQSLINRFPHLYQVYRRILTMLGKGDG